MNQSSQYRIANHLKNRPLWVESFSWYGLLLASLCCGVCKEILDYPVTQVHSITVQLQYQILISHVKVDRVGATQIDAGREKG